LAAIIIPGQSGTYRHLPGRLTGLLADSGLKHCQLEPRQLIIIADPGVNLSTAMSVAALRFESVSNA
jgi:hypothetical protein